MPITVKPENYHIEATATKRELQELESVLDKYIEENRHTSGDNPAWGFMKDFLLEIDKALYGREKRKKRREWLNKYGDYDDE